MRDRNDNVVIVCSIENVDPMGVHTGDSVTVAPAMTLTDREYQHMRDAAIKIIRAVGVDTGGCNIQFAVNPTTGRMVVIEMNPRVSRSSALASKATGFPIAKIAAKLAIGYTLDEIPNDITGQTPACFEPALDYVVVKIPRFAFEKFPGADTDADHAHEVGRRGDGDRPQLRRGAAEGAAVAGEQPRCRSASGRPQRRRGGAARPLPHPARRPPGHHAAGAAGGRERRRRWPRRPASTRGSWIRSCNINEMSANDRVPPPNSTRTCCGRPSAAGFSDAADRRAARPVRPDEVRALRHALGVRPVYHAVDTCAAEFAARTPYLYSTYDEGDEVPGGDTPKVIILGSGPNRIGQGIEFDYACVHASFALRDAGLRDRDGQLQPGDGLDRLRHLLAGCTSSRSRWRTCSRWCTPSRRPARSPGVIVQLGGQTPLGLARRARGGRGADRRHLAGGDPPRRGPRRVRARCSPQAGLTAPRGEVALTARRGGVRGGRDRLPGAGPAVVRARRARHGDRLRRGHAARRTSRRAHAPASARAPGADRPLPRRRDRDRRRRPVRRRASCTWAA